jgi:hypothetical protein
MALHDGIGRGDYFEITDDMDTGRLESSQLSSELGMGVEERPGHCGRELGGSRNFVDVGFANHDDVVGADEDLSRE